MSSAGIWTRSVVVFAGIACLVGVANVKRNAWPANASATRAHSNCTPGEEFVPVWSPDGRQIAFDRQAGDCSDAVYIVTVKSGRQRRLVAGGFPSWSPDGTRIAFGNDGIFTIRLDGTRRKRLVSSFDADYPLWSPNGSWIAYEGMSGIYVIRPDGTGRRRIVDGSDFAWSPDSAQLAFESATYSGISIVGRYGKGLRALPISAGNVYSPTWSPDGQEIAFSGEDEEESRHIYLIRSDGSDERVLTTGGDDSPTFSPNGKRIAFERSGPPGRQIWVMNRDGSDAARLTRGPNDWNPVWSPDGRSLAFVRHRGQGAKIWLIGVVAGRVVTGVRPRSRTGSQDLAHEPRWHQSASADTLINNARDSPVLSRAPG
jgi:Tol biopolymer transport system component